LLNLGQTWIATGRTTFGGFLLALHGGVTLGGVMWLAQQHNNWSLRNLWRRAPRARAESA
jgi:lipopolysaccharide export system permease protein